MGDRLYKSRDGNWIIGVEKTKNGWGVYQRPIRSDVIPDSKDSMKVNMEGGYRKKVDGIGTRSDRLDMEIALKKFAQKHSLRPVDRKEEK